MLTVELQDYSGLEAPYTTRGLKGFESRTKSRLQGATNTNTARTANC